MVGLNFNIMKKVIIALLITSTFFVACTTDETGGVSRVTNYPTINVLGDNPLFIPQGGTFTEPGVEAFAGDTEIPFTTTAAGVYRGATTLDTNIPDEYLVSYTATNSDGFDASGTRKVIVYKTGDLITSIEGVYLCSVKRNNVYGNPASNYQNIKYVYIWKNTNGTYQISDAFGGWYQYGRGLGLGYITPGGTINAVSIPGNSFTFPGNPLSNSGFGGTANIQDMTVDPVAKKIVMHVGWLAPTSYVFELTLTQVQL